MKIDCLNGFFIFREGQAGEISQLMSHYGIDLVGKDDYFTFGPLENVPTYSIKGAPLLSNTATATFSGEPWEVMGQNGLVFDLVTGTIKPKLSITTQVKISQAGFYFYSDGLLNPGSMTPDGKRVQSYRATLHKSTWGFRYSEVIYNEDA